MQPVTRHFLFVVLMAWAELAAARPAPQVLCHVTYGGETQVLRADPVASPYEVAPVAIGSYFLFRIVVQTRPAGSAAVKLYTYADREGGPVPIHQQEVAWPPPRPRPGAPGGFTGLQWVYEPVRDGELQYWCERGVDRSVQ
jgi:hypothetical protein